MPPCYDFVMSETEKQKANPPYLAFSTFQNALAGMAEHGVPDQIDKSIFRTLSGSDKYALMSALDFFGLVEDGKPTKDLSLIAAGTPEERKSAIGRVLHAKYPRALKAVVTGTPDSLLKNFDYETGQSVTQKCIRFFLNAAKEGGVQVSAHIMNAGVSNAPRKKRAIPAPSARVPAERADKNAGEGNGRGEGDGSGAPDSLKIAGLTSMPVAVGLGKTWYVAIDKDYSDDDIIKFTDLIERTLLKAPKKGGRAII